MNKKSLNGSSFIALPESRAENYFIDWEKVKKMKLEARYKYFRDLCINILKEPVVTPEIVCMDYNTYMIDFSYLEILREAYYQYKILRIKVGEIDNDATFEVDWKGLAKLSLEQRVVVIDEIISELQKAPINDSVGVQYGDRYILIDKSNRSLFVKCCDIREYALNGKDIFAGSKLADKKKNEKPKKEKQKKEKPKKEKKSKEKKTKEKKASVGRKGTKALAISGVALVMSGLALAGNYFGLFSLLDRHKNKDKDLKPDEKIEFRDFYMNPFTQSVIEENFAILTEEMQKKYEQEAKDPDTRTPREKLLDEYLEEYSLYFNLDSKKVIEIAKAMTNNYSKPYIDVIGNYLYTLDDDEEFAMLFTYLLSRDELVYKLDGFETTKEALIVSDEVITTDPEKLLTLRTGESFGEYVGRISELLGMDKSYALAIAYTISSVENKPGFNENNNFDGLVDENGEFVKYASPEAGIVAFLINLKQYEEKNVNSLEELSGLYLNHQRDLPDADWVKCVQFFHKVISESPEEYFGPNSSLSSDKTLELEQGTQK